MIDSIRKQYNDDFTELKYQQLINEISKWNDDRIDFRLAETPVFLDKITKENLLQAGDEVATFITSKQFVEKTQKSFSKTITPPNEPVICNCVVMDFAICKNDDNEIEPKLIELQGFPSLFGMEVFHDLAFKSIFSLPSSFSPYLNNYDTAMYLSHLKKIIQGDNDQHTILLEIKPYQQKTKVDFFCTQQLFQIPIVCLSEIFVVGNELFYTQFGNKKRIDRIYNRIVWDEIEKQSPEMKDKANLLLLNLKIEWVTHPNHFYRISKYILPFLNSKAVPSAHFLTKLEALPNDLENYVLKPLFSYAGKGVKLNITSADIDAIQDPENWILQQKVKYAPLIKTPSGPATTEIRLFYFWDSLQEKYIATFNLARISKGQMIGVAFNEKEDWVGGSLAYFEK